MRTVTIREAKAKLNELVSRATAGEQIVVMRGSRPAVTLTPVTESDLELSPRLTEAQAERFWARAESERRSGTAIEYRNPSEAARDIPRRFGRGSGRPARRT